MYCLSKLPSVMSCIRGLYVHRLYSSTDKPSKFPNLKKLTCPKKKAAAKQKTNPPPPATKKGSKPITYKCEAAKVDKSSTLQSLKQLAFKKSSGATGSGGSKNVGGDKKTPSKQPQQPQRFHGGDLCYMIERPKANSRPFRKLSYCLLPLIAGLTGYMFTHEEEQEHPFVPYDHLYKRQKRFFWRDGRTTLFHGRNNYLKDEEQYEVKPDDWEEIDLERRRKIRDRHAKEELERRRVRKEQEAKQKEVTKNSKENAEDIGTDTKTEEAEQVEPEAEQIQPETAGETKTEEENGKTESTEEGNGKNESTEEENGKIESPEEGNGKNHSTEEGNGKSESPEDSNGKNETTDVGNGESEATEENGKSESEKDE